MIDAGRPGKLHVCVVEDFPDAQSLVKDVLSYAGVEVTIAANGAILDSLLGQGLKPDMFLLDLALPGETGIEIMRRLRGDASWNRCPIVALTAFGFGRDRRQALSMGFDGYITKPIDLGTFSSTVLSFFPQYATGLTGARAQAARRARGR